MSSEAKWEKKLKIHTAGRDESQANRFRHPYEPTPYEVLERIAQSGLLDRSSRVVDYGCGMGRVGLFHSTRLGCAVTGVDCNPAMVERALQNARTCAGSPKVTFSCLTAESFCPDGQDSFYFFNPFSEEILAAVVERLVDSWYRTPREMRLLFYYPSDGFRLWLQNCEALSFYTALDCRDLFAEENSRETVLVYRVSPLE